MSFHFDHVISRENTACVKYDARISQFGTQNVQPMWVADMDFAVPDFISQALQERVSHPVYGYSFREESFYNATCNWMFKRHGWKIRREWVHFSPGIVPGLTFSVLALTRPGDQIIIQTPVYPPFYGMGKQNREILLNPLIEKNGEYTMDLEHLEQIITPKTRLLILCNPHNPVGRAWTREELSELAVICEKHQIIVLSDEIHGDIVFAPHKHCPYATVSEAAARHSIVYVSPAKTFNIAGIPASSMIISNPDIAKPVLQMLQDLNLIQGDIFGPIAYTAAYQHGEQWVEELREYLQGNIQALTQWARQIPGIGLTPIQATYLGWIDFRNLHWKVEEISQRMILEAGIGMNEGRDYGKEGAGFMRINLACPKQILNASLEKMEKVIRAHSGN